MSTFTSTSTSTSSATAPSDAILKQLANTVDINNNGYSSEDSGDGFKTPPEDIEYQIGFNVSDVSSLLKRLDSSQLLEMNTDQFSDSDIDNDEAVDDLLVSDNLSLIQGPASQCTSPFENDSQDDNNNLFDKINSFLSEGSPTNNNEIVLEVSNSSFCTSRNEKEHQMQENDEVPIAFLVPKHESCELNDTNLPIKYSSLDQSCEVENCITQTEDNHVQLNSSEKVCFAMSSYDIQKKEIPVQSYIEDIPCHLNLGENEEALCNQTHLDENEDTSIQSIENISIQTVTEIPTGIHHEDIYTEPIEGISIPEENENTMNKSIKDVSAQANENANTMIQPVEDIPTQTVDIESVSIHDVKDIRNETCFEKSEDVCIQPIENITSHETNENMLIQPIKDIPTQTHLWEISNTSVQAVKEIPIGTHLGENEDMSQPKKGILSQTDLENNETPNQLINNFPSQMYLHESSSTSVQPIKDTIQPIEDSAESKHIQFQKYGTPENNREFYSYEEDSSPLQHNSEENIDIATSSTSPLTAKSHLEKDHQDPKESLLGTKHIPIQPKMECISLEACVYNEAKWNEDLLPEEKFETLVIPKQQDKSINTITSVFAVTHKSVQATITSSNTSVNTEMSIDELQEIVVTRKHLKDIEEKYQKILTELHKEKSQRMINDELIKILQTDVTALQQRNVLETTDRLKLENKIGDLKAEYEHSQKLVEEKQTRITELEESLNGTMTLVRKLEEQSATIVNKGGIDYLLQAKIADGRAKEAEEKLQVLQAELLHSQAETKRLLTRMSELSRERHEMVSGSVHNQLLNLADERAQEAEMKVKELEQEVFQLKTRLGKGDKFITERSGYGSYSFPTLGHSLLPHTNYDTLGKNIAYTPLGTNDNFSKPLLLSSSVNTSYPNTYTSDRNYATPEIKTTTGNYCFDDLNIKKEQDYNEDEVSVLLPDVPVIPPLPVVTASVNEERSYKSESSDDWSSSEDEIGDSSLLRPSAHMNIRSKFEWLSSQKSEVSTQNISSNLYPLPLYANDNKTSPRKVPPPIAPKPKALRRISSNETIQGEGPVSFEEATKAPGLKLIARSKGPIGRRPPSVFQAYNVLK